MLVVGSVLFSVVKCSWISAVGSVVFSDVPKADSFQMMADSLQMMARLAMKLAQKHVANAALGTNMADRVSTQQGQLKGILETMMPASLPADMPDHYPPGPTTRCVSTSIMQRLIHCLSLGPSCPPYPHHKPLVALDIPGIRWIEALEWLHMFVYYRRRWDVLVSFHFLSHASTTGGAGM